MLFKKHERWKKGDGGRGRRDGTRMTVWGRGNQPALLVSFVLATALFVLVRQR